MWEGDDPHARFWKQLTTNRAREFMGNHEVLRSLRRDYERAKQLQRLFGHVWAEYGTDIFKLTAEACGENWDFEDEEKNAFARAEAKKEAAVKQRADDDDVVAAREASPRRGLDELQGISEESECILEEEEGFLGGGQQSPEEEGRQEEEQEKVGRRGADFYRRAGGTC